MFLEYKEGIMKIKKWVCEICAQGFDIEVDLLAHQFNSSCEKDMEQRTALEQRSKNENYTSS